MDATLAPRTAAARRLLLIEDSPSDARMFEAGVLDSVLHDASISVEATLEDGLRRLETDEYDAVIVDLGLPDSDGIDTFLAVSRAARDIPVIVMTGLDDSRLAEQAVLLGAQDYLVKATARRGEVGRAIDFAVRRQALLRALTRERAALVDAKRSVEARLWDQLRPQITEVRQRADELVEVSGSALTTAQRSALSGLLDAVNRFEQTVTCTTSSAA